MPKKQRQESQAEQSARFERDAQAMIDAGELSPTEADEAMERILARSAARKAADPE